MVENSKNQSVSIDSQLIEELVQAVRSGLRMTADSIFPLGTFPGSDASGTNVASLTEAVMGLTSAVVQLSATVHDGLSEIKQAIEDLDR